MRLFMWHLLESHGILLPVRVYRDKKQEADCNHNSSGLERLEGRDVSNVKANGNRGCEKGGQPETVYGNPEGAVDLRVVDPARKRTCRQF